jgi:nitrogen PTS system EIIA component
MRLNVREAAELLRVSTKTIYRWVADERIPAYRVSHGLRFDRTELVEWATANRIEVEVGALPDHGVAERVPPFDTALLTGGIHYRVDGANRDAVLTNAVRLLRVAREDERDLLHQAIRAREEIASTAIGDGIAIPHLRNPVRLHLDRASIALCFLDHPVDWRAPDAVPVSVLFIVTGPTVRTVLGLQSQTWFALRDAGFRETVLGQHARDAIFKAARRATARFAQPGGAG